MRTTALITALVLSGCFTQSLPDAPDAPSLTSPSAHEAWVDELSALPSAEQLAAVAEEFAVPADLLSALAWAETGFATLDGPVDRAGWLGLDASERSLAGQLLGLDPARIARDPAANLAAGAALLGDLRDRYAPGTTELDARWWPVVTAWSDAPQTWQRELFAAEVFNTLQAGLVAPTERMAVSPDDDEIVSFAPYAFPGLAAVGLADEPAELAPDYPAAIARHAGAGADRSAVRQVVVRAAPYSYADAVAEPVSAHYLIRRGDGAVRQLLGEDQVAAGAPEDAVVVAVAGAGQHFGTWTPAAMEAAGMLGAWLTARHGLTVDAVDFELPVAPFPASGYLDHVTCLLGGGSCVPPVGVPGAMPEPGGEARDSEGRAGPSIPYFYQYSNALSPGASCQNTSIAMVLRHYGWTGNPDTITSRFGKDRAQSPGGLADVFNTLASEAGLSVRITPHTNGTLSGFRSLLAAGKPTIVHGYFTGYGHVLVALEYTGSEYRVNDPAGRWAQSFKGGYPYGWHSTVGKSIRYGASAFEWAVTANGSGSGTVPMWYHEITGVPDEPVAPPVEPDPEPEPGDDGPGDDGPGAPEGSGAHEGSDGSDPSAPADPEDGAFPWADIEFVSPRAGDVVSNPVLLRADRRGGDFTTFWAGPVRLSDDLTPNPASATVNFTVLGERRISARSTSQYGTVLAVDTIEIKIEDTDQALLTPYATALEGSTYRLTADVSVDAAHVEYRVDGWLLDDDATGSPEATGAGFPLTYTFSGITAHRLLVGRAYDEDGTLVAEGSAYVDIEMNAFPECTVAGQISCGQTISGTTLGLGASDVLNGYGNAVGNWSGPEVAYTWSGGASEIEIALLNPDPGVLDHDILILEQSAGTCVAADQALVAFNSLRFETTPGATYTFVVDGYDGDAGPFELHLDCNP